MNNNQYYRIALKTAIANYKEELPLSSSFCYQEIATASLTEELR